MSETKPIDATHLEVQETLIPTPTTVMSPALPEATVSEGTIESSCDEAIKRDVEVTWEDLIQSLCRLQHEVTNKGATAHLEEAANAEEVVDFEYSQSSSTPDFVESNDASIHSAYWSDHSASWNEDSEDAEDQEGRNGAVEERGHDHAPQGPIEGINEAKPLEYGEISFKDLIDPENYSNEYFELKKSHLGGVGAFAKRDLKLGEVILVERPTIKATPWNYYEALDELPPELQAAIGRMHGHRRSFDQDYPMAIFMTNSFGVRGGSCLYLIAARFNHACNPVKTVDYRIVSGDIIEFKMKKDVPAGTELTIAYGPISPAGLYSMWGFRCNCGGCRSITDEEVAKIDRTWDEGGVW